MGRLFANDEASAALVVVLSGMVARLVARGPDRASPGRILSRVPSNPVPRRGPSGARESLSHPASEREAAA